MGGDFQEGRANLSQRAEYVPMPPELLDTTLSEGVIQPFDSIFGDAAALGHRIHRIVKRDTTERALSIGYQHFIPDENHIAFAHADAEGVLVQEQRIEAGQGTTRVDVLLSHCAYATGLLRAMYTITVRESVVGLEEEGAGTRYSFSVYEGGYTTGGVMQAARESAITPYEFSEITKELARLEAYMTDVRTRFEQARAQSGTDSDD